MQVDVEKLVEGATVLFPEAATPAEIVSVRPGEYWTFVYRDDEGLDEITLSEGGTWRCRRGGEARPAHL